MIGRNLGPYKVTNLLGQGGMGAVYEAVHEQIGRRVAIKLLHPQLALEPEHLTRFLNEARAVNCVDHPGVVQIFDVGTTPEGGAYLIMEYLRGDTLRARIAQRGRALCPREALPIALQLADTLAATHAQGIIHRDLKPTNVMLIPDPTVPAGERIKLLDFGIAKLGMPSSGPSTQTGLLMGTPYYMAPEQWRSAARVDAKADVYSLGVLLFELLVGQPPFQADDAFGFLFAHVNETAPSLRTVAPQVPQRIAALVAQMLAKDSRERPTMIEVAAACKEPDADVTRAISRHEAATWQPRRAVRLSARRPHRYALVALVAGPFSLLAIGLLGQMLPHLPQPTALKPTSATGLQEVRDPAVLQSLAVDPMALPTVSAGPAASQSGTAAAIPQVTVRRKLLPSRSSPRQPSSATSSPAASETVTDLNIASQLPSKPEKRGGTYVD